MICRAVLVEKRYQQKQVLLKGTREDGGLDIQNVPREERKMKILVDKEKNTTTFVMNDEETFMIGAAIGSTAKALSWLHTDRAFLATAREVLGRAIENPGKEIEFFVEH